MTSLINPNNIDGAYPVAGQDNNSQGFRDNFTNTKTNFAYASQEITDLQNKVVLKSPLTGSQLNNDMGGTVISNVQLQEVSIPRVALGTVSGLTVPINYAAGGFQTLTTGGNVGLNFINFPAAGTQGVLTLEIDVFSASHQVTFPAGVNVNNSGIPGFATSNNTMSFAVPGIYTFQISSNGTSFTINQTNNILTALNNSNEDLVASAAASLSTSVSYFSTSAAETATLAAGVSGQVKVFAMYADSGDMVITVTNAGWKTSGTGTMTFSAIGQACTLKYVNSKWFCIGNNGVSFA
jgi:hypothetical protein